MKELLPYLMGSPESFNIGEIWYHETRGKARETWRLREVEQEKNGGPTISREVQEELWEGDSRKALLRAKDFNRKWRPEMFAEEFPEEAAAAAAAAAAESEGSQNQVQSQCDRG